MPRLVPAHGSQNFGNLSPLLTAVCALLACAAQGATSTWDGGTTGSGVVWDTAANWVGDTLPASGSDLVFGSGSGTPFASAMTLSADFTVGRITFDNSTSRLPTSLGIGSGSGNNTLTINSGVTLSNTATSVLFSSSKRLDIVLGATAIFNVQNAAATLTLNPAISGGSLTKTGAGTMVLGGAGTYTGATTVSAGTLSTAAGAALTGTSSVVLDGGTLLLGGSNQVNSVAPVSMNGGTLATGGFSQGTSTTIGLGVLTLSGSSTLDLGAGNASVLHFSASNGPGWSGILTVQNYSGLLFNSNTGLTSGTAGDALFFGNSNSGLTATQLGEIQFVNPSGLTGVFGASIGSDGAIYAAVPEPATVFSAIVLLGFIGYSERRRFGSLWASAGAAK